MTTNSTSAPFELHTPEDLLAGAESLLMSGEPQLMRAVVLEAITALEAYVHSTIFGLLKEKLDPLLFKWLEEKTRTDFDTRLSVFTPVALGRPVEKGAELWKNYKEAKEIRNKVTHLGRKVTKEEAKFVVQTVYDWLSYLGSTAEVDLALLGLKKHIERASVHIDSEQSALNIVIQYFQRTKAGSGQTENMLQTPQGRIVETDLILTFGRHKVAIESKFIGRTCPDLPARIDQAVKQLTRSLLAMKIMRGAVMLFHRGELPPGYDGILPFLDGRISAVVIKIL